MAAVYYQQDWPRSELVTAFSDNVPFTKFCRALTAYGLDVTARESAPYSCMSYGGCVNGYRSEGEVVSIKDYRLETHTCSEGDDACGQYDAAAEWHWNEGHAENKSYSIWKEDGTHDVTVFFPVIFPDGATGSELSDLPEEYNAVADGKIKAADCTGNIVLDKSANLYKGELNDWFYTPDELTVTFTVVTGEGDDAVSDDYEVTFSNATAIPWCPGELNDGQYGHYDLDCTIYLTGYDRYTDPETQAPNGADGGTGNLEALAESCDAGTLTRTIIKQDQYGNEYAGNAVSARYTKTVTLPKGACGFQGWYKDGEDLRKCGMGIASVSHGLGRTVWNCGRHKMPRHRQWHDRGRTAAAICQPEYRHHERTRSGGRFCSELSRKVCLCPAIFAARRAGQSKRGHQSRLLQFCSVLLLGAEPAFFRRQHSRLSERSRPSKYFPV